MEPSDLISSDKRNSLEFLMKCELDSIDEQRIQEQLKILMLGHEIRVKSIGPGLVLYRGIKYPDKPKYWDELIYPPKSLAKVNRASKIGEPMFYCSTLKKVPFYELFIKKGDRLVITTWVLKKEALFSNIGYTKSNLTALGTNRKMPFDLSDLEGKEKTTANDIISDYLSSAFCKVVFSGEEYYYKLTNAIAKQFLLDVETRKDSLRYETVIDNPTLNSHIYNLPQRFLGIQYPTIHNNGIEDNFAISPEAIDDNLLEIEKIEYIEFVEKIETKYQYKLLDIALSVNESLICWKNLDRHWILYDNQEDIVFVDDNGIIEAYTPEGDLLDPI